MKDLLRRLIKSALQKGADEAEGYLRQTKNLTIEVKNQKVDTLESSITMGYCIRIIRDKRLGFSYSTDPEEIAVAVDRAIASSAFSEPDECNGLPQHAEVHEVRIFDERIALLRESDAAGYVMGLERAAFAQDSRIKKIRKALGSFSMTDTHIINSHDIDIHYTSTSCSAQMMAIAEEGPESQVGWDYEGNRFLDEVSFGAVGQNAARKAVNLLGAKKISPMKGLILLDSAVVTEFLDILSASLSSEAVQKKKSFFSDKKDEPVASRLINIIDSGLIDGRLGSRPVDAEGVPTKTKILVEQGVLRGLLYNTYTAKKDGRQSTGNAVRSGSGSLPSVGPTNIYIEPVIKDHTTDLRGLQKIIDKGLYVIETMGMHTANPISGDFSVGASGLWIERGEVRYPVKEVVISGNILDLFNNIILVGDDLKFYGNIGSPSLVIEGIDISG